MTEMSRTVELMRPSLDGHYEIVVHIGPCSVKSAVEFSEKITDAAFDGDYGPIRGHVVTVILGHRSPNSGAAPALEMGHGSAEPAGSAAGTAPDEHGENS